MLDKINYYFTDNLEYMRTVPDKYYDLVIADPEQGKKLHGGKFYSGFAPQKNGSKVHCKGKYYKKKAWDHSIPSDEYFDQLFRISKHVILWGVQYFPKLQLGPGRIIWDKVNDGSDQYSAEIAYNSLNDRVELFRFMWRGMMQGKSMREGHIHQGDKKLNEPKFHPTQKPSSLYKWIFTHFNIHPNWKIFDPNLGSGSIGIACLYTGHRLDACENEKEYFDDAKSWLYEEYAKLSSSPLDLFNTQK